MGLLGLRRGDITIHGVNGEQFGFLWHRLLFSFDWMPAAHFGPLQLGPGTTHNPASAPDGHSEPTLPAPIDADTPVPGDQDSGVPGSAANPTEGTPAPRIEDFASPLDNQAPFRHPPYFAPTPISEAPVDGVTLPGDSAPPAGPIPKSEALIWSGLAIMAFPADPHETSGDGAASDGDGDTASSDAGAGNLSTAFLPPGTDELADLPHGLDLGFAFTPPPLPPPPDMI
jgi:hypothetical protein